MFPWSRTIPEGWAHKPIPNPNAPKFVSVSSTFTRMRTVGTSSRFRVNIATVTLSSSEVEAGSFNKKASPLVCL